MSLNPEGATSQDEQLARQVQRTLMSNVEFETNPVNVVACEGDVMLSGMLPDGELRQLAGQLAVSVSGVRSVINRLEVSGGRA